ncbi:GPP34 family phosphoprotein [Miniimonas sp. S16]|uniref:GOLPH3/VPS74 family protein n=1 Tax=Miniimonas sp. S16 TaxID=2171623 RepID=UPI000D528869|nr:GPP34 family phosphoprotein [Miniimonas sp. S16]
MDRPLAADLLLLTLDEDKGTTLVDSSSLGPALLGATLVGFVLDGTLGLTPEKGEIQDAPAQPYPVGPGRFYRTSAPPPEDALLARIAEDAAGKKPKDAITSIGVYTFSDTTGKLRGHLTAWLVAEGLVQESSQRVLGLFPRTVHPARDPRTRRALLGELRAVYQGSDPATPRTAALAAVVGAIDAAPRLFPDLDKRALKGRAKQLRETQWAGRAVAKTLEEITTVIIAAAVVPTIVVTSGS